MGIKTKNETNGSDFGMQLNSKDTSCSSDSVADYSKFSDGMKASAILPHGDTIINIPVLLEISCSADI